MDNKKNFLLTASCVNKRTLMPGSDGKIELRSTNIYATHGSLWVAFTAITIIIITMAMSSNVYAQTYPLLTENENCINCHENLYFLHDTGKWFCIKESPMQCIDCHGGDPSAITQEEAHANRKAHPIINEDVTKCQECHPEECDRRVIKFDQQAGISKILIAESYQPMPITISEQPLAEPVNQPVESASWISAMEIIVLIVIVGLALSVFGLHKARRK